MNLSLAITTYNRCDLLFESFAQVLNDDRIDDIVILDDCSKPEIYAEVKKVFGLLNDPKIKLIRQAENRGMSLNKRDAVAYCKNDWVILFDSDNVIGRDYLDALFDLSNGFKFSGDCIFCPSFASPNFDYSKYESEFIDLPVAKRIIKEPMGNCLFNTCNYVVNKKDYLEVYEHNPAMKGTDTIYFNYLWLKAGGLFYVVPGMQYFHRVHDGSGFMEDVNYNMKKAEEVKKLILSL